MFALAHVTVSRVAHTYASPEDLLTALTGSYRSAATGGMLESTYCADARAATPSSLWEVASGSVVVAMQECEWTSVRRPQQTLATTPNHHASTHSSMCLAAGSKRMTLCCCDCRRAKRAGWRAVEVTDLHVIGLRV